MTREYSACRVLTASATRANYLLWTLLLCMLALVTTDRAFAQTATVEFNIPAQTVPAALNDFARQARVQLFFITDGFEDVQANAVVGTYDRQEALTRLLAGTGLQASLSPNFGIKVSPAADITSSAIQPSRTLTLGSADISNDRMMAQVTGENPTDRASQGRVSVGNDGLPDRIREEILVTGSRIRGARSASPVVTITRQEIDRAGFATVEELVDKLPQNFSAGATLDNQSAQINTSNVVGGIVGSQAGGASVNLRGLGASSTLILLNGRRMSPSGRGAGFTNISSIPVTAIERVEVLTDGASAIYGSDAIGGVVNFILRDDYEGAETRVRYGSDSRGDTSNILFGQSFGKAWDDGNVLLTYEYYDSDNLANGDRAITASRDLTSFGGTDRRTPGGNPANISAGGQLWAIPAGQDGTSLTAADFPVGAGGLPVAPPNLFDDRLLGDVLPALERHSAVLHLNQAVGSVKLFADVRFSSQETLRLDTFGVISFDVTGDDPVTPVIEGNPFFVDPTGTGLTTVRIDNYSFENDFSERNFGEIDTFGVALGVQFDIGENWNGEFAGNWSKEETEVGKEPTFDAVAFDAAVNQTDPNLAFNPFGDGPTNPAVIATFIDRSRSIVEKADNELWTISLNIDGSVFDVPGGRAQLATGIEFREESLLSTSDFFGTPFTSNLSRDVTAVYAELFFPLVSSSNSRPGLQRFEISLAARYEDYSDFGDAVNPKVGIVWSPTESLILRGTYGTSFRAPALIDLDASNLDTNASFYIPQFFADIGLIPFPMIVRVGGSEDLQAEEATTWTAGFQWRPAGAKGLSLDVTYFNVDFEDRIDIPFFDLFSASFDPRFSTLLNTNPTDEQTAALINDPRWDNIFGVPEADILSGVAPVGGILDGRLTNLSRSVVTGVELQLAYQFETTFGKFDVGLNGNYLFDFERALVAVDPLVDEVDTYGRPVDFKARGNVTWSTDSLSVSGFVNYVDGYTDNINDDPARSIDSWTTVDLNITYDIGENTGFLSDTRFSLTTQNLFDKKPPFVNTIAGLAYDSVNGNPLGRFLTFQVSKDW